MSKRAEINDIYEGAYLLQSGCHLENLRWETGVDRSRSGDGHASFIISGDDIREHMDTFRSGKATGNICLYLFSLERLKDKMFTERRRRGGKR